ncbi:WhiB family transcriptional regulator [Rhodococcus sp. G-MC3]|uniref:WhiB family transcriptional regulator n=1 Tax=Rhodococcus sp. G-MC3 TaxID=3046209 RepID=UPI0030147E4A
MSEWEWQLNGACRSMPISMFYPARGLKGYALKNAERSAKLVCAQCPVVDRCLQHALRTGEPYGIWGGQTATERSNRRTTSSRLRSAQPHCVNPASR